MASPQKAQKKGKIAVLVQNPLAWNARCKQTGHKTIGNLARLFSLGEMGQEKSSETLAIGGVPLGVHAGSAWELRPEDCEKKQSQGLEGVEAVKRRKNEEIIKKKRGKRKKMGVPAGRYKMVSGQAQKVGRRHWDFPSTGTERGAVSADRRGEEKLGNGKKQAIYAPGDEGT